MPRIERHAKKIITPPEVCRVVNVTNGGAKDLKTKKRKKIITPPEVCRVCVCVCVCVCVPDKQGQSC